MVASVVTVAMLVGVESVVQQMGTTWHLRRTHQGYEHLQPGPQRQADALWRAQRGKLLCPLLQAVS